MNTISRLIQYCYIFLYVSLVPPVGQASSSLLIYRKSAASFGLVQRSITVRSVVFLEQLKRCSLSGGGGVAEGADVLNVGVYS